jgi:hypothetical protein
LNSSIEADGCEVQNYLPILSGLLLCSSTKSKNISRIWITKEVQSFKKKPETRKRVRNEEFDLNHEQQPAGRIIIEKGLITNNRSAVEMDIMISASAMEFRLDSPRSRRQQASSQNRQSHFITQKEKF